MGWWKVQYTEDVVGDEPFGILEEAICRVVEEYEREFGRLPTRSEWQRLLETSLQPFEDLGAALPGEPPPLRYFTLERSKLRSVAIMFENAEEAEGGEEIR